MHITHSTSVMESQTAKKDQEISEIQQQQYNNKNSSSLDLTSTSENSMNEPIIVEISSLSNDDSTYRVIKAASTRGGDMLFDGSGYSYTHKTKRATQVIWRCVVRNKTTNCAATVNQNGNKFQPGLRQHIHPPNFVSDTAALITSIAKRRSIEKPFTSASEIVAETMTADSACEISSLSNDDSTYRIVKAASTRGGDMLFDGSGYSYTRKNKQANHVIWRCVVRNKTTNCAATVDQNGNKFQPGLRQHNHPPNLGSDTTAIITANAKRRSIEKPLTSASEIVAETIQEAMTANPACSGLPSLHSLIRCINDFRKAQRLTDSMEKNFSLRDDCIPTGFLIADIMTNQERHLVFATKKQLKLLRNARIWYADATFKIVGTPFIQMFTILAFMRKGDSFKHVPLVYCMMTSRSKQDYIDVFQAIINALPRRPRCRRIVLDFETPAWEAAQEVMPHVDIRGCAFHFTQAIDQHVQHLGLQERCIKNASNMRYVKKLKALCFLPDRDIVREFEKLERCATRAKVGNLLDLVRRNWIDRSAMWSPEKWSVYQMAIRTSKDVEDWHAVFNKKGRKHSPFYMLIEALYNEAQYVNSYLQLVAEETLKRHQRETYETYQKKIFKHWRSYGKNEITADCLLQRCAEVIN